MFSSLFISPSPLSPVMYFCLITLTCHVFLPHHSLSTVMNLCLIILNCLEPLPHHSHLSCTYLCLITLTCHVPQPHHSHLSLHLHLLFFISLCAPPSYFIPFHFLINFAITCVLAVFFFFFRYFSLFFFSPESVDDIHYFFVVVSHISLPFHNLFPFLLLFLLLSQLSWRLCKFCELITKICIFYDRNKTLKNQWWFYFPPFCQHQVWTRNQSVMVWKLLVTKKLTRERHNRRPDGVCCLSAGRNKA